MIASICLVW